MPGFTRPSSMHEGGSARWLTRLRSKARQHVCLAGQTRRQACMGRETGQNARLADQASHLRSKSRISTASGSENDEASQKAGVGEEQLQKRRRSCGQRRAPGRRNMRKCQDGTTFACTKANTPWWCMLNSVSAQEFPFARDYLRNIGNGLETAKNEGFEPKVRTSIKA